jgi:hypothetical protein
VLLPEIFLSLLQVLPKVPLKDMHLPSLTSVACSPDRASLLASISENDIEESGTLLVI